MKSSHLLIAESSGMPGLYLYFTCVLGCTRLSLVWLYLVVLDVYLMVKSYSTICQQRLSATSAPVGHFCRPPECICLLKCSVHFVFLVFGICISVAGRSVFTCKEPEGKSRRNFTFTCNTTSTCNP